MTTAETTSETQSTLTPWDRKTMRLQTRLDEIDTEIARVRAKHADKITEANARVAAITQEFDGALGERRRVERSIARVVADTEDLQSKIRANNEMLLSLRATLTDEIINCVQLSDRLNSENRTRDITLAEPSRHMAALDADRESVAYRLQQHQARKPNTALFVGVKP